MNIAKTIYSCKHTEYDVVYTPDIVYAHRESGDLTMQIVSPIAPDLPRKEENFYNPIAELMKVVGGEHGTGIWSREMLEYTAAFFKTYLG